MPITRRALFVLLAIGALQIGGCASLQQSESIDVILAGVEPLEGEGLELRMLIKLRVQNPNDMPLAFNGVAVQMDVQGKRFASGVSDTVGSVPRFGETVVSVPVSISVLRIARQAYDAITKETGGKLAYELSGKLAGPAFGSKGFSSKGELTLPAELFGTSK